ncbi:TetR/AcrR family transcriptional regulator [Rhizobium leguminosarum]|uniref:TetR/AcrR family transcriptional regulator n=1 Tax=Rhizobium leguminosarum TaxID=384 RepID=A0ACD5FDY2_RHILE|nr:TetR/AcrR family transcriptional regulator [Rhizobium leguminosarum]
MNVTARDNYHHGELRSALIAASDEIIRESGVEGFSLREAARRAGVSPGAPKHHFGSMVGLLTEVAISAYAELARYLSEAHIEDQPVSQRLRSLGTAYVRYALDNPGHFRLICRKDLVNRHHPDFEPAVYTAMTGFVLAAAEYYGSAFPPEPGDAVHPGIVSAVSTIHGIAHMAIEDKFSFVLRSDDPEAELLGTLLPSMLNFHWPV